ncbi:MAG: pyruvate kinase [Terrimicrobiaceae bacterium]
MAGICVNSNSQPVYGTVGKVSGLCCHPPWWIPLDNGGLPTVLLSSLTTTPITMPFPANKTKIVATIGPASCSPDVLLRMIRAGVNVARLNFSHGDFETHAEVIRKVRKAAAEAGRRVAIMADLPGPKMRLGVIDPEPILLEAGAPFVLTSEDVTGNSSRVSMTFDPLPRVVHPGDRLFLNDGLSQLVVEKVEGNDVHCRVAVGGELRSRKGLNLPGIELGISAFTSHDKDCLAFALSQGVDAISQSFVESAADLEAVRAAARELGHNIFLIAKIERRGAISRFDEILEAADGIMVARGDLGVEIPIEQIAVIQKELIGKANRARKPVITATQMLESMTSTRLPTRAEATDVANAILDGTDCVMLSGESAVGKYPEESVAMLARIAEFTESKRPGWKWAPPAHEQPNGFAGEVIGTALRAAPDAIVVTPTHSGHTARLAAGFRGAPWTLAFTTHPETAQGLCFTYGVQAFEISSYPDDWRADIQRVLLEHEATFRRALLVTGPSEQRPDASRRLELVELGGEPG